MEGGVRERFDNPVRPCHHQNRAGTAALFESVFSAAHEPLIGEVPADPTIDKHRENKLADIATGAEDGVRRTPSGEILKEIREELKMTQGELAVRLDYSRPTIGNAETGYSISRDFIERYAKEFPAFRDRLALVEPTSERVRVATLPSDDLEQMFLKRATTTPQLDGTWFALWETTADREEVINSEEISAKTKRGGVLHLQNVDISAENPKGGYLWVATCRVFDNQYILGTYIAREPNVRSKGCLYLVIHRSGRFIDGQWIGCNYDGDWARGLVVMGRDRDALPELMQKHRAELPPLPYGASGQLKGVK